MAGIADSDKLCEKDSDCTMVMTSCTSCCPTYSTQDMSAVNVAHAQDYANPKICTEEHIRQCGVPECGMMPNTPQPAAVCLNGTCQTRMTTPDGRLMQSAP